VVGCVRKEGRTRFAEECTTAAVLLGKNDLIEEKNGGVISGFCFAFMDELVEACKNISGCARPAKYQWSTSPEFAASWQYTRHFRAAGFS